MLNLSLQPSDSSPTRNEMAKALEELHLNNPEGLDDSWDYPIITKASSVTDYCVTRPGPEDSKPQRKKEVALSREGISSLEKEVEDLAEQSQQTVVWIAKHEARLEALRQDALQGIAMGAEQAEAGLYSHQKLLFYEIFNRALQALNDIIMDTNRTSNPGTTIVLSAKEKKDLKKKRLGYITQILPAAAAKNPAARQAAAQHALECLTPNQRELARFCSSSLLSLRKHRNTCQHPQPSKAQAIELLNDPRLYPSSNLSFETKSMQSLIAFIHTSPKRLPLPNSAECDLVDLFGEEIDKTTRQFQKSISDLKKRKERLEPTPGAIEADGSGSRKRKRADN
ncbi:hypothetical protein GALMADRAFT_157440 [Galerina marginata CBS 339.88]|uniref:Uncharacterized protein n=1 Tax=Galerina marginata (strain CBS 339.88) TaxID=685588 RepID=A0A067SVH3_GALM3|nr:hypothetical protein GALMADRAFT_157440 [Galerina marginata CBS 339.88]